MSDTPEDSRPRARDSGGPAARALIVLEEKPICRVALAELAAQCAPFGAARFASSFAEALATVEAGMPTLALVDLFTINYDFRGIRRLLDRAPGMAALAIDDRVNPTFARLARDAGARGYASKNLAPDSLRAAVTAVTGGCAYFPTEVMPIAHAPRSPAGLSPWQLDVLKKLAVGKTNKEIAEALGITPGTVKLHIHAILKLTGARNRTEAALIAGRFIAPTIG